MKRFELMNEMLEYMNKEQLLEELVSALSNDEARELFEHIAQTHDLPVDFEEEN